MKIISIIILIGCIYVLNKIRILMIEQEDEEKYEKLIDRFNKYRGQFK